MNLNLNEVCKLKNGNLLSLNKTKIQKFKENTFNPYQNYQFILQGFKEAKNNSNNITVSMVEIGINI